MEHPLSLYRTLFPVFQCTFQSYEIFFLLIAGLRQQANLPQLHQPQRSQLPVQSIRSVRPLGLNGSTGASVSVNITETLEAQLSDLRGNIENLHTIKKHMP